MAPTLHQSNMFKWFVAGYYVSKLFDVKMDVSIRNATTQVMGLMLNAANSHLDVDIRSGLQTAYLQRLKRLRMAL